ncbi:MAG: transglutaminase-like cysteine peptidase [Rhodospirillales bacterium]
MTSSRGESGAKGSPNTRGLAGLVLLLALAAFVAARPAAAADGRPSYFQSIEFASTDIAPFGKWRDALARTAREMAAEARRDCAEPGAACPYRALDAFLDTLRHKRRHEQLVAVNAYMNARPYVSDLRNWGEKDYWATPGEFLTRSGDCEDYAIAKFFALRRLGWSAESLRLAAVKDTARDTGHAVLIAFDGATSWLLDNQIKPVVATDRVDRYEPVYSINEHAWWRHQVVAPSIATRVDTVAGG